MRKESRAMDSQWALEVMRKAPYITVSFIDEDGKAYGLPLSLASDDGDELVPLSWCLWERQEAGGHQGSSRGLSFSRNPLCANGWPEGRQFHPAIPVGLGVRQGRNRDRRSREDSWTPTGLQAISSTTHGRFRPGRRPFLVTHGRSAHHAY